MKQPLALNDLNILPVSRKPLVNHPRHIVDNIRVKEEEISVDIRGIACFKMMRGKEIRVYKYPGAAEAGVLDQLRKWGLMSILHQRRMINFHASSFTLSGKGIMICGDSGSGKSSVTAAFSLGEGVFLNDDITAISFKKGLPVIEKIETGISLLPSSLQQLMPGPDDKAGQDYKRQLTFPVQTLQPAPLACVINLHIHEGDSIASVEVTGHEKFSLLRSNICSWEMLKGMPGTEEEYMRQLLVIGDSARVVSVGRPADIGIRELADAIGRLLSGNKTNE